MNNQIPRVPRIYTPRPYTLGVPLISLTRMVQQSLISNQQENITARTPTTVTDPWLNLRVRDYYRRNYEATIGSEIAGRALGGTIGAGTGFLSGATIGGLGTIIVSGLVGLVNPPLGATIFATTAANALLGGKIGAGVGGGLGLLTSDYTTAHASMDLINNHIIASFKQGTGIGILNTLGTIGKSMDIMQGGEAIRSMIYSAVTATDPVDNILKAYGLKSTGRKSFDFEVIREELEIDLGGVPNFAIDMVGELITDPGFVSAVTKGVMNKTSKKLLIKELTTSNSALNATLETSEALSSLVKVMTSTSKELIKRAPAKTVIGKISRPIVSTIDKLNISSARKRIANAIMTGGKKGADQIISMLNVTLKSDSYDNVLKVVNNFIEQGRDHVFNHMSKNLYDLVSVIDAGDDLVTGVLFKTFFAPATIVANTYKVTKKLIKGAEIGADGFKNKFITFFRGNNAEYIYTKKIEAASDGFLNKLNVGDPRLSKPLATINGASTSYSDFKEALTLVESDGIPEAHKVAYREYINNVKASVAEELRVAKENRDNFLTSKEYEEIANERKRLDEIVQKLSEPNQVKNDLLLEERAKLEESIRSKYAKYDELDAAVTEIEIKQSFVNRPKIFMDFLNKANGVENALAGVLAGIKLNNKADYETQTKLILKKKLKELADLVLSEEASVGFIGSNNLSLVELLLYSPNYKNIVNALQNYEDTLDSAEVITDSLKKITATAISTYESNVSVMKNKYSTQLKQYDEFTESIIQNEKKIEDLKNKIASNASATADVSKLKTEKMELKEKNEALYKSLKKVSEALQEYNDTVTKYYNHMTNSLSIRGLFISDKRVEQSKKLISNNNKEIERLRDIIDNPRPVMTVEEATNLKTEIDTLEEIQKVIREGVSKNKDAITAIDSFTEPHKKVLDNKFKEFTELEKDFERALYDAEFRKGFNKRLKSFLNDKKASVSRRDYKRWKKRVFNKYVDFLDEYFDIVYKDWSSGDLLKYGDASFNKAKLRLYIETLKEDYSLALNKNKNLPDLEVKYKKGVLGPIGDIKYPYVVEYDRLNKEGNLLSSTEIRPRQKRYSEYLFRMKYPDPEAAIKNLESENASILNRFSPTIPGNAYKAELIKKQDEAAHSLHIKYMNAISEQEKLNSNIAEKFGIEPGVSKAFYNKISDTAKVEKTIESIEKIIADYDNFMRHDLNVKGKYSKLLTNVEKGKELANYDRIDLIHLERDYINQELEIARGNLLNAVSPSSKKVYQEQIKELENFKLEVQAARESMPKVKTSSAQDTYFGLFAEGYTHRVYSLKDLDNAINSSKEYIKGVFTKYKKANLDLVALSIRFYNIAESVSSDIQRFNKNNEAWAVEALKTLSDISRRLAAGTKDLEEISTMLEKIKTFQVLLVLRNLKDQNETIKTLSSAKLNEIKNNIKSLNRSIHEGKIENEDWAKKELSILIKEEKDLLETMKNFSEQALTFDQHLQNALANRGKDLKDIPASQIVLTYIRTEFDRALENLKKAFENNEDTNAIAIFAQNLQAFRNLQIDSEAYDIYKESLEFLSKLVKVNLKAGVAGRRRFHDDVLKLLNTVSGSVLELEDRKINFAKIFGTAPEVKIKFVEIQQGEGSKYALGIRNKAYKNLNPFEKLYIDYLNEPLVDLKDVHAQYLMTKADGLDLPFEAQKSLSELVKMKERSITDLKKDTAEKFWSMMADNDLVFARHKEKGAVLHLARGANGQVNEDLVVTKDNLYTLDTEVSSIENGIILQLAIKQANGEALSIYLNPKDYDRLKDIGFNFDKSAEEVHHITKDVLIKKAEEAKVNKNVKSMTIDEMFKFLLQDTDLLNNPNNVIQAHNAQFDIDVLFNNYSKSKYGNGTVGDELYSVFNTNFLDTNAVSQKYGLAQYYKAKGTRVIDLIEAKYISENNYKRVTYEKGDLSWQNENIDGLVKRRYYDEDGVLHDEYFLDGEPFHEAITDIIATENIMLSYYDDAEKVFNRKITLKDLNTRPTPKNIKLSGETNATLQKFVNSHKDLRIVLATCDINVSDLDTLEDLQRLWIRLSDDDSISEIISNAYFSELIPESYRGMPLGLEKYDSTSFMAMFGGHIEKFEDLINEELTTISELINFSVGKKGVYAVRNKNYVALSVLTEGVLYNEDLWDILDILEGKAIDGDFKEIVEVFRVLKDSEELNEIKRLFEDLKYSATWYQELLDKISKNQLDALHQALEETNYFIRELRSSSKELVETELVIRIKERLTKYRKTLNDEAISEIVSNAKDVFETNQSGVLLFTSKEITNKLYWEFKNKMNDLLNRIFPPLTTVEGPSKKIVTRYQEHVQMFNNKFHDAINKIRKPLKDAKYYNRFGDEFGKGGKMNPLNLNSILSDSGLKQSDFISQNSMNSLKSSNDVIKSKKLKRMANSVFNDLYLQSDPTKRFLGYMSAEETKIYKTFEFVAKAVGISVEQLITDVSSRYKVISRQGDMKYNQLALTMYQDILDQIIEIDEDDYNLFLEMHAVISDFNPTNMKVDGNLEAQNRFKIAFVHSLIDKHNFLEIQLDKSKIKMTEHNRIVRAAVENASVMTNNIIGMYNTPEELSNFFKRNPEYKLVVTEDTYVPYDFALDNSKKYELPHHSTNISGRTLRKEYRILNTNDKKTMNIFFEHLKDNSISVAIVSKDDYNKMIADANQKIKMPKLLERIHEFWVYPIKYASLFLNIPFVVQNITSAFLQNLRHNNWNPVKTVHSLIETGTDYLKNFKPIARGIINNDAIVKEFGGREYMEATWMGYLINKDPKLMEVIEKYDAPLAEKIKALYNDEDALIRMYELSMTLQTNVAFGQIDEVKRNIEKEKINEEKYQRLKEQASKEGCPPDIEQEFKIKNREPNKGFSSLENEARSIKDKIKTQKVVPLWERLRLKELKKIMKKDNPLDKIYKVKSLNIWNDFNSDIEIIFRNAMLKDSMQRGESLAYATMLTEDSHFIYNDKALFERYAEVFIPFLSYPIKAANLFYELGTDYSFIKPMYAYLNNSWGDQDDDLTNNYLLSRKAKGDIPVGNHLIALGNPLVEALSTITSSGILEATQNKLHPLVRPVIGSLTGNGFNSDGSFMAGASAGALAAGVAASTTGFPGGAVPVSALVGGRAATTINNYTRPNPVYGSISRSYFQRNNNYYQNRVYPRKLYLYQNQYTKSGYSRIAMNMQLTSPQNLKYRVSNILYRHNQIRRRY